MTIKKKLSSFMTIVSIMLVFGFVSVAYVASGNFAYQKTHSAFAQVSAPQPDCTPFTERE